jgi:IS30 family transposase
MGRNYEQLSLEDRCEIARLSANGGSVRQIAAALDRSPSTVSRELKRNRGAQVGYKPGYAQQQTRARRWKGSRLERDESLRAAVLERLASGWSPEQIAGRLKREQQRSAISYESIYRFIYAQLARTKDYRWRHYLPRGKSKRGCRGRKGGGSPSFIEGRVSVANRPIEASDRSTCGHWEADLMMFSKYGQAILAVHERKSRLLLAVRLASKAAHGVARHLLSLFGVMPQPLRQTVTFDNGTEFARHRALHSLAIDTFFCDPYAPWQKGGVENAIGRIRRFIPRKTDLATLSTRRFHRLIAAYNHIPRKCLDWHTPAEVFAQQLLHFECESTSPRSRGRHLWQSPARRAGLGESLADPQQQPVQHLAIGFQLLLAIALGAGGVLRRPVFDVGRQRARQFQRLVMRFGRQRNDQVEVEPLPIVKFLEGGRLVA